jgi:hypothetical protein
MSWQLRSDGSHDPPPPSNVLTWIEERQ